MIMDRLYGGVCYAGIDTDPELKYPKGAGRVAFSNQQSYIAAISARFVQLQHGDIDKRVEVKPYVLDDQMCDECQGQRCGGKFAPFFCANVTCLQVCLLLLIHVVFCASADYAKSTETADYVCFLTIQCISWLHPFLLGCVSWPTTN